MEVFGLSPAGILIDWLMDMEYDCQLGISREFDDMEIQF
jgi:hypothetical protein